MCESVQRHNAGSDDDEEEDCELSRGELKKTKRSTRGREDTVRDILEGVPSGGVGSEGVREEEVWGLRGGSVHAGSEAQRTASLCSRGVSRALRH